MKFEYAVFTIRIPWRPLESVDDWPIIPMVKEILDELNRLGDDGWEVFERSCPVSLPHPLLPDQLFPYSFWARRVKA